MADQAITTGSKYTVASLFAGIGGFCSAFKNVGFDVRWANEVDVAAATTYRLNFPEVQLFEKSISDLSVQIDKLEPVDVLTAGFPCQPYSVAGNKLGFKDPRGQLFFEIIRLLREFGKNRPKILILENVKNLIGHDDGKTFSRIVSEIQSIGYWFKPKNAVVLNTLTHTQIPQNRERLFMAALSWEHFRRNEFKFPDPVENQVDYIDLLDLEFKSDEDDYFAEGSKYWELFNQKMNEGDPRSVYQLRRWYVRELQNYVVPTLTANMGEGGHNKPVIRDSWGIRNLSIKECLRFQGFNINDFSFPETISKSQKYKQIGNAVTVPLVKKIAIECRLKLESIGGSQ